MTKVAKPQSVLTNPCAEKSCNFRSVSSAMALIKGSCRKPIFASGTLWPQPRMPVANEGLERFPILKVHDAGGDCYRVGGRSKGSSTF